MPTVELFPSTRAHSWLFEYSKPAAEVCGKTYSNTKMEYIKSPIFSTHLVFISLPDIIEIIISQYKKKSNPTHKSYLPYPKYFNRDTEVYN